jgi:hypothetical protein
MVLYTNGRTRQLSLGALDALKEFYKERDDQLKKFEDLKAQAEADLDAKEKLTMDTFQEDWNHSQFWVGFLKLRNMDEKFNIDRDRIV